MSTKGASGRDESEAVAAAAAAVGEEQVSQQASARVSKAETLSAPENEEEGNREKRESFSQSRAGTFKLSKHVTYA